MLTVNSQTAAEIAKESRHFSAKLIFGNNEYTGLDSFVFTSHFSPQSFTIGCLTSASVKCDVRGLPASSASALKGQVFWLKIAVGEPINEWISLGEFKITEATKTDGVVSLTAYDKNNFVNGTYSTDLTGSQTVKAIFADICGKIGEDSKGFTVGFKAAASTATLNVDKLKGYSYKDALSYLAAFAGGCVIVNRQGQFEIRTYSKKDYGLLNNDRIETPKLNEFNSTIGYLSAVLDYENVISSGNTALSGFSFVCPVMTKARLNTHANNFTSDSHAVHTFRPGKVTQLLGDPRIEVGDVLPLNPVYDADNAITSAECYIPVMSLVIKYDGGLMNEITALDFAQDSSLSLAQRIDFAEKSSKKASVYSQAASEFSGLISGGLGMYRTEVTDASGAVKTYLHDKPTLSESSYIVTFTSTGLASSNQWGGSHEATVWTSGVSLYGDAVMRTIAAKKITADMISVTDLSALNANIGGWTIKSSIIEKDNTSVTDADGNPGYRVGMQSYSASPSAAAFFAGCSTASGGSIANRSSSKFYVTHGGFLYAQNAEITGEITATSLKLKDCKLSYNSLKDTPDLTVYITKSGEIKRGTVKKGTNGITISSDGLLQASNAVIYGKILATEGEIGGWNIREKRISSANNNDTYSMVQSTGNTFLATGLPGVDSTDVSNANFIVYHSGKLVAKNAEITGEITATSGSFTGSITANGGTIGGFNIASFYIVTKDITWGTDGSLLLCSTGSSGSKSIGGSEKINGWVITAGSKFGVTKDGIMYADGATISGDITASSGYIGGWEIRAKRIASANNDGTYSMVQSTGNTFLATGLPSSGSTDTSNTKFIVYHSGKLVATEAEITGKIIANSGTIGKFTVDDTYKYMITTGYSTFGGDGCLYFNPTGSISSKQIGGSDKRDGWVITAGSKFGVDKYGYVFCTGAQMNKAAFTGATTFAGNVTLAGNYIYCSHSTAFAWSNTSAGTNIWASVGTINNKTAMYLGVPTWTLRLNASAVQLKDGTAVTSDERLKTDIRYFDERYVDFFNRLIPRTFKYIEGTSDRTHFGFIAQEMLNAIEQSGMSTKDIAAFVSVESARDGFEGEEFAIRYGEIVALNTYMIQKLIAQNNELLDEITQLKNEISILKGATK